MSHLEKQSKAAPGSLSATAKLANPAATSSGASKNARASPSPSIASDAAGNSKDAKRKRDGEIYSQPAQTGYGNEVRTQLSFAVEYLKGKKGEPKTAADIIGHLSLRNFTDEHKRKLMGIIRTHPRVEHRADESLSEQTWETGTYIYSPKIAGVKDKTSLLAYLQRKKDASHTSVKDLKDGWPDCDQALEELERAHKILIVRTAKDNIPRNIWIDDPSLHHHVDPEFRVMWSRVQLPELDDMHRKLVGVGQKPASDDPLSRAANGPAKSKQPKKRAGKRTGKATNVHMAHLMQDYSNMRR